MAYSIGSVQSLVSSTNRGRIAPIGDNKFVFAYVEGSAAKVAVATVDGETVTLGTPVTIDSDIVVSGNPAEDQLDVCRVADDYFAVVYVDDSDDLGYAKAGSVSGTTITLGAAKAIHTGSDFYAYSLACCTYNEANYRFLAFCSTDNTAWSTKTRVALLTVNTGTLALTQTDYEYWSTGTSARIRAKQMGTDLAVMGYVSTGGYLYVNTFSGTTSLTRGTALTQYSGSYLNNFDIGSNASDRVCVVYSNTNTTTTLVYGYTYSSGTLTYVASYAAILADDADEISLMWHGVENAYILAMEYSSSRNVGELIMYSSGRPQSWSSGGAFSSTSITYLHSAFDGSSKGIIVFTDSSGNTKATTLSFPHSYVPDTFSTYFAIEQARSLQSNFNRLLSASIKESSIVKAFKIYEEILSAAFKEVISDLDARIIGRGRTFISSLVESSSNSRVTYLSKVLSTSLKLSRKLEFDSTRVKFFIASFKASSTISRLSNFNRVFSSPLATTLSVTKLKTITRTLNSSLVLLPKIRRGFVEIFSSVIDALSSMASVSSISKLFSVGIGVSANVTDYPEVTTSSLSGVGESSITAAGVLDDANGTVTEVGFDVSKNGISWSSYTTAGTYSEGSFSKAISHLDPNTHYYIRAKALNEIGWGYGEILTFWTLDRYVKVPLIKVLITHMPDGQQASITARGTVYGDKTGLDVVSCNLSFGHNQACGTCTLVVTSPKDSNGNYITFKPMDRVEVKQGWNATENLKTTFFGFIDSVSLKNFPTLQTIKCRDILKLAQNNYYIYNNRKIYSSTAIADELDDEDVPLGGQEQSERQAEVIIRELLNESGIPDSYIDDLPETNITFGEQTPLKIVYESAMDAIQRICDLISYRIWATPDGRIRMRGDECVCPNCGYVEEYDGVSCSLIPCPNCSTALELAHSRPVAAPTASLTFQSETSTRSGDLWTRTRAGNLLSIESERSDEPLRNYIVVKGYDESNPNNPDISSTVAGLSDYVPTPPTYRKAEIVSYMIDTQSMANVIAQRVYTDLNRISYTADADVVGINNLEVGKTVQFYDDYACPSGMRYYLYDYTTTHDNRGWKASLGCVGGVGDGSDATYNQSPVAIITSDGTERQQIDGNMVTTLFLNGLESYDPGGDDDDLTYLWVASGYANQTGSRATYTVASGTAVISVTLTVTDSGTPQLSDSTTRDFTVVASGTDIQITEKAIFVAADTYIYATLDGGQSWTELELT